VCFAGLTADSLWTSCCAFSNFTCILPSWPFSVSAEQNAAFLYSVSRMFAAGLALKAISKTRAQLSICVEKVPFFLVLRVKNNIQSFVIYCFGLEFFGGFFLLVLFFLYL
jgi:hypothetical protein